ncbi:MAG: hypothetical protein J3Q66DRAFT_391693 [Benniella sp.]|nr:MAG: hypothetical protein J3Q66DRAFT_391693 [Benniella sp.]
MASFGHQDLATANSEPILRPEDRVNTDRVSHKQTDEEVFLIGLAQGKRPLEEDESTPCQEHTKRQLLTPKASAQPTRARSNKNTTSRALRGHSLNIGYKANKVNTRVLESSGDLGVPKVPKRPLTVPKSPNFSKGAGSPSHSIPLVDYTPDERSPLDSQQRPPLPSLLNASIDSSCQSSNVDASDEALLQPLRSSIKKSPVMTQKDPTSVTKPGADGTKHPNQKDRTSGAPRRTLPQRLPPQRVPPQRVPPQRARSQTPRPTTVPVPFKFETDIRAERHMRQFLKELEEWREMEKENRPPEDPAVFTKEAIIRKSTRALTRPESFRFLTEDRAQQRQHLRQEVRIQEQLMQDKIAKLAGEDELRKKRELTKKAIVKKAREDELRKKQEATKPGKKQEATEQRKRLAPYPTPISRCPPPVIQRSTRPLTIPRSPSLGLKRQTTAE